MPIGMVAAFGMLVAVGRIGGTEGISCVSPGLGRYMGAQLDTMGVAGAAQLDMRSVQRSGMM
jgi:hypothetical protein